IKEYLKDAPSIKELKELVKALNCKPIEIVRKKEPLYIEKFLNKKITDAQWFKILHEHPILIERPIIIDDKKAVIGRPPELIINFLKKEK
ncbi:MAG: arsenate reductase (glutaredoxin), partial [Bacteroidia bacterium]|nr:arsenate reductase (glutaredoxin) [Bacteroidia bacterium]